jgi:hypothetical protein
MPAPDTAVRDDAKLQQLSINTGTADFSCSAYSLADECDLVYTDGGRGQSR